jgi:hypothetical protein
LWLDCATLAQPGLLDLELLIDKIY